MDKNAANAGVPDWPGTTPSSANSHTLAAPGGNRRGPPMGATAMSCVSSHLAWAPKARCPWQETSSQRRVIPGTADCLIWMPSTCISGGLWAFRCCPGMSNRNLDHVASTFCLRISHVLTPHVDPSKTHHDDNLCLSVSFSRSASVAHRSAMPAGSIRPGFILQP